MNKKLFNIQFTFFSLVFFCLFYLHLGKYGIVFGTLFQDTDVQDIFFSSGWIRITSAVRPYVSDSVLLIYPLITVILFVLLRKYLKNEKVMINFQFVSLSMFLYLVLLLGSIQVMNYSLCSGLLNDKFNYMNLLKDLIK